MAGLLGCGLDPGGGGGAEVEAAPLFDEFDLGGAGEALDEVGGFG
jgi:hypothetical protein